MRISQPEQTYPMPAHPAAIVHTFPMISVCLLWKTGEIRQILSYSLQAEIERFKPNRSW
jgi:hypothetical protein